MTFFAHPWALWLLLALPALALLVLFARRSAQQTIAQLGSLTAIRTLVLGIPGTAGAQWLCLLLGGFFLIVAICGPQWGRDDAHSMQVFGNDVVVVLDLSRSMLAEKPSRQERARRAVNTLCDGLAKGGGHRVALVVFAARAELVFPLTHDIEHLRAMVTELDADALPASFRPDADAGLVSGTRMGEGIQTAAVHLRPVDKSKAAGQQDIILISDGDDPAGDGEWQLGIEAAVARQIPVHTISVGDPQRDFTIPYQGEPLRHLGQVVATKVNEAPLEQIARATGGEFVPGRTGVVPLDRFFHEIIEPRGRQRIINVPDDTEDSAPRQRYAWFLAPGFAFLASSMLIRERRRSPLQAKPRRAARATPAAAVVAATMLLLGSDSLPTGAELIRAANAAFASGQFDQAAVLYDQAARITSDPGLVAFNKATALYRQRDFAEAEKQYRRCLEDQEASPMRKARCLYDLGNCLVQLGGPQQLRDAVDCYRAAMQLATDDQLQRDAAHNLTVAKMIWLKLPAEKQAAPEENDGPKKKDTTDEPKPPSKDPATDKKNTGKEPKGAIKEGNVDPEKTVQKMAAGGKLLNLPDNDRLTPLSPANTQELLQREIQRMLQGRRETRQSAVPLPADVKDW